MNMINSESSIWNQTNTGIQFDVVLFHSGCPDGIGAAFPFYLNHKQNNIKNKLYIGVKHYQPYPKSFIKGKNVAIVDFSYNRTVIKNMAKYAKFILILDHHKTANDQLNEIDRELKNVQFIYDPERSGAQIAWDYVFNYNQRPLFIDYIADRDLWEWKLHDSRNVNTGMYHKGYTKNLNAMYKLYTLDLNCSNHAALYRKIAAVGREINVYINNRCKLLAKYSQLVLFQGLRTRIITVECNIMSDVSDYILNNHNDCDIVLNYNFYVDDGWRIQLRSNKVDLTHIIKKYSKGGGHSSSASFKLASLDHINNHVKIIS